MRRLPGSVAAPARTRYPLGMRRLLPVLLVPLLATLVAGCGGGDGGDRVATADPIVALRSAPETTADAGPAKLHYTIDTGTGQVVEADGVADMAKQLVSIDMDIPGAGAMRMLLREKTMYLQVPEAARAGLGTSTPWVSMDVARTGEAVSGLTGGGLGSGSGDPTDALAALEGVSKGGVQVVGTEDVRGASTTHYRAAVDLRKALERQSQVVDREAFERFATQLGGRTTEYDVWLDGDGLVRKMSFGMPVQGNEVRATIELYDFGQAEVPAPPSPDEVTDITDRVIAEAASATG